MASIGPNSVSVGENNTSIGTTAWNFLDGTIFTSNDLGNWFWGIGTSNRLVARAPGFSVPAGATIDGIEVKIESGEGSASAISFNAKLWNGTSTTADNSIGTGKTLTPNFGAQTIITLGSPTDLWGATLTHTIVNSASFGVCFWVVTSGFQDWDVDHVQMTVYYTPSGGGGSVQQSCIVMCG